MPTLTERSQIKVLLELNPGIIKQEQRLREAFLNWWQTHEDRLLKLPETKDIVEIRAEFLSSFTEALRPIKILEFYQAEGTFTNWFDTYQDDFETAARQNFQGLVENRIESQAEALGKEVIQERMLLLEANAEVLRKEAIQEEMLLLLDEFEVSGVIASWWNEIQYDLKTIAAQNFDGLIEGWIETIRADLEDTQDRNGNRYDHLSHKLVKQLLPKYLEELEEAEAKKTELESQLLATKKSDEESEEAELEDEAQLSEAEIKKLRQELAQIKKRLTGLRQISSPNKAQSSFISEEYVPILVQPLHKTERHRCPKRL